MTRRRNCAMPGCCGLARERRNWCGSHAASGGRRGGKGTSAENRARRDVLLASYDGECYCCAHCTFRDADPKMFDVDQIVRGKGHKPGNIAVLCPTCHRRKTLRDGAWS